MAGGQRSTISSSLSKAGSRAWEPSSQGAEGRTYLWFPATADSGPGSGHRRAQSVWAPADPDANRRPPGREARQAEPSAHSPDHGLLIGSDRICSGSQGMAPPLQGPRTATPCCCTGGSLRGPAAADPFGRTLPFSYQARSPRSRSVRCIEGRASPGQQLPASPAGWNPVTPALLVVPGPPLAQPG